MTRKHWKELLPVITAFANGEDVQFDSGIRWTTVTEATFEAHPQFYRIAPKPRKVWVNEYPGFPASRCFCFHLTKEQADHDAGNNRIACHEIELPPLP
jgi:hypothetical protein